MLEASAFARNRADGKNPIDVDTIEEMDSLIERTFEERFAEVRPPETDTAEPEPAATARAAPAQADRDETGTARQLAPPRRREGIVRRTVLALFRIMAAVGRFLIR